MSCSDARSSAVTSIGVSGGATEEAFGVSAGLHLAEYSQAATIRKRLYRVMVRSVTLHSSMLQLLNA